MKDADFLSSLIRTGYFPAELPPVITTRHFAKFCKDEFPFLNSKVGDLLKLSTRYETFTAPRQDMGRRNLALVHPLGQLGLSLILTKYRRKIKNALNGNITSLYSLSEDTKAQRGFKGLDFQQWRERRSEILSSCEFVMRADISRFFYTAYTHSIPWAVLGKKKAKELHHKHKLSTHWSNDLDRALQACQDRETFGIPVGPDTSRLIAELLMRGTRKTY